MPAGFLGNARNDVTVFTLADHQSGVIYRVALEVTDGRKEQLVPAAQEDAAAILQVVQPGLLVFNAKAKGPAVGTDDMIKRALNLAG